MCSVSDTHGDAVQITWQVEDVFKTIQQLCALVFKGYLVPCLRYIIRNKLCSEVWCMLLRASGHCTSNIETFRLLYMPTLPKDRSYIPVFNSMHITGTLNLLRILFIYSSWPTLRGQVTAKRALLGRRKDSAKIFVRDEARNKWEGTELLLVKWRMHSFSACRDALGTNEPRVLWWGIRIGAVYNSIYYIG